MLGLDYSRGRPSGKAVKAAGYDFVIRYCGQPGSPKNITKAEADDMFANGVAVALVFEATAARASQGFAAGAADATAATAHQAAVGIPVSRPIYYAVDYDAVPSAVEPYFQGANSVPGPDSAYGSFQVVRKLRADGLTVDSWQTVAWSKGQVDDGRDVFQRLGTVYVDGVACDVNEAFTADFGQYPVGSDDMTGEEHEWLRQMYASMSQPYSQKKVDVGQVFVSLVGLSGKVDGLITTVAKLSTDPDITPEQVAALLDQSIAAHTPTAEQIAAATLPALEAAVREVLGEDNAAQADAVVSALAHRLQTAA